MEFRSNILSTAWLKPIIGLVRDRDFDEAYALAEYFPATPGRKLVQDAILLGQNNMREFLFVD